MSSIVLSAAGSKAGSALGLALGGPRLADLSVQTSTYGKMIPIVYGKVRIAGNILWSLPIKETIISTTTSAAGGRKLPGLARRRQAEAELYGAAG